MPEEATHRRTKASAVMIAAAFLVLDLGVAPVSAGSGTQSDPWLYRENVFWSGAYGAGAFSGVSANIQPILIHDHTFWATNPDFTTPKTGFYGGLQRRGMLKGFRNGEVVTGVAAFSLFGLPYAYRLIDAQHCSPGADGGEGVSCAIEYNWSANTKYLINMTATAVVQPSGGTQYCLGGPGTHCTVWTGYVSPASNPYANVQIGKWSTQGTGTATSAPARSFWRVSTTSATGVKVHRAHPRITTRAATSPRPMPPVATAVPPV